LLGADGHALLIDCTTLDVTPVQLPDDIEVVVVDSGERRSLSTVGYADRRDEVTRAAELLGPLSQATLSSVEALDDEVLRKRARHVVTENQRVRDVVELLGRGDIKSAGLLMTESHHSLRDNQEVTTAALDDLVERLVATPGVFGARLTGGGWGGCVVALTEPGVIDVGWRVRPSSGASVANL